MVACGPPHSGEAAHSGIAARSASTSWPFAEALLDAGTMVLYGGGGVLDDYSAYQVEMWDAAEF